jgi:uncharacterized membrane protein HdeD (DUF308 family)
MSQSNDAVVVEVEGGIPSAISWQLQLLTGVITLVLGIILVVNGSAALSVVCVILGLLLIISGIFHFIRALDRGEAHRVWLALVAVFEVVLGVVFIRHFHFTELIIALWIGITWIIQGLLVLMVGILGSKGRSRVWPIIFGLLSLAAGIVVVSLPHSALSTLVYLLGIIFLVMGALEIIGGFFLRHDLKQSA